MNEIAILLTALVATAASAGAFVSAYRAKNKQTATREILSALVSSSEENKQSPERVALDLRELYQAMDEVDNAVVQIGHHVILSTRGKNNEKRIYSFELDASELDRFERFFKSGKSAFQIAEYLMKLESPALASSEKIRLLFPDDTRESGEAIA